MKIADIKIKRLKWREDNGYLIADTFDGVYEIRLQSPDRARRYIHGGQITVGTIYSKQESGINGLQTECNKEHQSRATSLIAQIVEVEP